MSNIYFSMKAKYKRSPNRIYFSTDFKDGEEVEFKYHCEKPSSKACGNAWYGSTIESNVNLINVGELETIE